jgi:hypothetical protein
MNHRQYLWTAPLSFLILQAFFAPVAHAQSGQSTGKRSFLEQFYSDNHQIIAATATIALFILFTIFVFKVGPEKIARKIYELLKMSVKDETGRSVIVAVFAVIAAGVGIGLYNSRIFDQLKDSSYARGVITYLVTIATIGLIFIIVLQIMFVKKESEEQVKGAREVLAILAGILGTIVGFYFGQTTDSTKPPRIEQLAISPITDGKERITAFVNGGVIPYKYTLSFSDGAEPKEVTGESNNGIIVEDIATTQPRDVDLSIIDAHNSSDKRHEAAPEAGSQTKAPSSTAEGTAQAPQT